MTWTTSSRVARLAARTRFALLALVALFLGHDAVYATEHGVGGGFANAMTELGHGAYWGPFTLAAVTAGVALTVASGFALAGLHRRLARSSATVTTDPARPAHGAYLHELASIWPRLLLVVVALYAIQENIETYLVRGDLPGVDVLFGGDLPLAVPVLALVTLALAAIGALVRWRIAILSARLQERKQIARLRVPEARPAREWASIHAAAPHRWILDRRDAGRAPPRWLPA